MFLFTHHFLYWFPIVSHLQLNMYSFLFNISNISVIFTPLFIPNNQHHLFFTLTFHVFHIRCTKIYIYVVGLGSQTRHKNNIFCTQGSHFGLEV